MSCLLLWVFKTEQLICPTSQDAKDMHPQDGEASQAPFCTCLWHTPGAGQKPELTAKAPSFPSRQCLGATPTLTALAIIL